MFLFSGIVNDDLKLRVMIFCESASIRVKNKKLSIMNKAHNIKHTRAAIDNLGYGIKTALLSAAIAASAAIENVMSDLLCSIATCAMSS